MINFSFVIFIIILLTAFPVSPQNQDSLIVKDSLISYSAMPEFIPDKNKDYKIFESILDSTIDYKIMKTLPGEYPLPVNKTILLDSVLKKYYPEKKFKK